MVMTAPRTDTSTHWEELFVIKIVLVVYSTPQKLIIAAEPREINAGTVGLKMTSFRFFSLH